MIGPTPSMLRSDRPRALAPKPAGTRLPARFASIASLVLVGVWLVVATTHLGLSPEQRLLTWTPSYMVIEVLAGASLAYRAWNTIGQGRVAWSLLAISALLEVPTLTLSLTQLQGLLPEGLAVLRSYLTLTSGALTVAGVLSFPREQETGGRFRRRLLDSLVFAAALLFLLWVMGIQGSLRVAAEGIGLRVFSAYLNAALLGGGLVFMTSYHPDGIRGPLGWLAASALSWLVALSCWTLNGLPSVVATHSWIIVAGAIPLFQGLAAWSPKSVEEVIVEVDVDGRAAGLLSYLPVTAAVGVLAAMLAWAPQHVTRGAYAIFLGMVVLLLLRQFQAIQDLQAARETLAERVRQRTQALEQAQEAILRTERMNTLAMMGAGLAHDLNNLLGAVKGSADLALLNLEGGLAPRVDDLRRITTAADRAALLTRKLMDFARREKEDLHPMNLGREVRDMEATLRLLLPRSVVFSMGIGTGAPLMVMSTRVQLEQMLVNLVANAADAMPKDGTLSIRVDRAGVNLDQAMIEVKDSGMGMTPEVLSRIFDAFFTTKAPGKGTGLGLSSLKAMVEEGGGHLEVDSEPGRGSRFRIFVPLHSE